MPTAAGVKMQELEETKRHNKASLNEHLGSTLGGSAIGALGRIGAAVIKKNDPELYKRIMSLFETSANLPFPYKRGRAVGNQAIDGVLAIYRWVPTIGTEYHVRINSPIMIAAKSLFSTIRGKNSGSTNYDAVDLMIVNLALDSILCFIDESIRALRIANRTEELNHVTRQQIVTQLGYQLDDLVTNKDRWLNAINKAIEDLNTLYLPGGLSYFQKHRYLSSWALTEHDITEKVRTRFHIFKMEGYFTYDEINGELDFNSWPAGIRTYSTFTYIMDQMISPLLNSDAVAIMAGDIESAVSKGAISESAIIKLTPYTDEDIKESPYNYDEDMLNQLKNATIVGTAYSGQSQTEFSIHQAVVNGVPYIYQGDLDGSAATGPKGIRINNSFAQLSTLGLSDATIRDQMLMNDVLLTSKNDVPTPDEIIESTRLQVWTSNNADIGSVNIQALNGVLGPHGSEIVLSVRLCYYSGYNNYNTDTISYIDVGNSYNSSLMTNVVLLTDLQKQFKYVPILRGSLIETNSFKQFINYQNYTYRHMREEELRPLHECALRSQFVYSFTGKVTDKSDETKKSSGKSSYKGKGKKNFKKFDKSKKPQSKSEDKDKDSKDSKSNKPVKK